MAKAQEIFNATMSIIDELSANGQAQTNDTLEYSYRTPAIINILLAELNTLFGNEDFIPINAMADDVQGVNNSFALGIAPYGLAAHLLLDENPTAAAFFQARYEELLRTYVFKRPAEVGDIVNLYGGFEHNDFGRWK